MSGARQMRYEARKRAEGRCPHCGGAVVPGKKACAKRLESDKARKRKAPA